MMTTMAGSVNHDDRVAHGWIEGAAMYADEEPHHARRDGGAWTYVPMHHAATERILSAIITGIDDDGIPTPVDTESPEIAIVTTWPKLSDDADADFESSESDGTSRAFLLRSVGNDFERVPLTCIGYIIVGDGNGFEHIDMVGAEWIGYETATLRR
jgi:hypothetical protein